MAMGQAAGMAAHLAIEGDTPVSKVDVEKLQRMLLERGQVLTYFKDLDAADPAFRALQFFGTKGFFPDYYARSGEPLESAQAAKWLKIALPDGKLPPESSPLLRPGVRRGEFCRALYEQASKR